LIDNRDDESEHNKNLEARLSKIDPGVQRRILRFVNAARRPEHLAELPNQGIQVIGEHHTFKGPELHEPVRKPKHKVLLDIELAKKVIEWRENNSPLYGLINIKPIIDKVPADLLDDIISAFGPSSYGKWDSPIDIPNAYDRPIHAALIRTGGVLFIGLPTGNTTFLWNPSLSGPNAFSFPSNQPTDSLFCSGHSFLSDGKLLVVGGGGDGTGARHNHGWKFNPDSSQWARIPNDMHFFRWYPTCVTLGDEPGRVLIVSGRNGADVAQMEMYFESSDLFEKVWGPAGEGDTSANRSFPQLYPGLNLLPGGEIFYTPTGWSSPAAMPSAYFSFSSTSSPVKGSWNNVGPIAVPPDLPTSAEEAIDRDKGMGVLLLQTSYPFVQVMVVGGGSGTSTSTYQMINLSELDPEWGPPLPMPDGLARINVNLVLLPDNRVFVCGGLEGPPTRANGGACWIYDPSTFNWYEMDELSNPRQYHSVALLLPDGRVMAAGNEWTADRTIEIFSPPYLFNPDGTLAARPSITSTSPDIVHHGTTFAIETPDASNIGRVVLARPMAVTHQTDSEQRIIPLSFTRTGSSTLAARAPNGWHPHALAPRGWYMLFILDNNGTPSVARFIYLH
jgi:hypothetical protein